MSVLASGCHPLPIPMQCTSLADISFDAYCIGIYRYWTVGRDEPHLSGPKMGWAWRFLEQTGRAGPGHAWWAVGQAGPKNFGRPPVSATIYIYYWLHLGKDSGRVKTWCTNPKVCFLVNWSDPESWGPYGLVLIASFGSRKMYWHSVKKVNEAEECWKHSAGCVVYHWVLEPAASRQSGWQICCGDMVMQSFAKLLFSFFSHLFTMHLLSRTLLERGVVF